MKKYFESHNDAMKYRKNNSLNQKPISVKVWLMGFLESSFGGGDLNELT